MDGINGNTYWGDGTRKEMTNVMVAFDIIEKGENLPNKLRELGVRMIHDVKMDLTQRAILVADGHKVSVHMQELFQEKQ